MKGLLRVIPAIFALGVADAYATALPGPADPGRMDLRQDLHPQTPNLLSPAKPRKGLFTPVSPEGSKDIRMVLKEVHLLGMTAFPVSEVEDIYAAAIGHEISMDTIWEMAGRLTERYQNAGYFLSRAVVPEQKVSGGIVTIRVIEGYIADVKCDDPIVQNEIVAEWLARLRSFRPVKTDDIESVLLHLNDLPGVDLHAVLQPIEDGEKAESSDGAVRLLLEKKDTPIVSGSVGFDNFGSHYLGPYEGQLRAQAVYWPTQRTTMTAVTSLPFDEMNYINVTHEMPVFPGGTLGVSVGYTKSSPGYTLHDYEIKGFSTSLGVSLDYRFIRQRQENLTGKFGLDVRETSTDILGSLMTRDSIRVARFGLNYQKADSWGGSNVVDVVLSQGLQFLGASDCGDQYVSRAFARPDFTKIGMNIVREQEITESWRMLVSSTGQWSSGPLYSSEQFGYGGQSFGRAYDNSEIIGDRGLAGSVEARYFGMGQIYGVSLVPYGSYDIGAIWNHRKGATILYNNGSSISAGVRFVSEAGVSGSLGLAFPLSKATTNPLYGNGKNPRYFMQVTYGF